MAKFTKGAWEIEPWIEGGSAIVAQDNDANNGHVVCVLSGPDAEANGRLFLSSRALYEALRNLVVMLPSDCPEIEGSERVPKGCVYIRWQDLREARVALALAEGKKE